MWRFCSFQSCSLVVGNYKWRQSSSDTLFKILKNHVWKFKKLEKILDIDNDAFYQYLKSQLKIIHILGYTIGQNLTKLEEFKFYIVHYFQMSDLLFLRSPTLV